MNEEFLSRIAAALEAIATAMHTQTHAADEPAPSHQRTIGEYARFDWTTIDATIGETDQFGATIVMWAGREFTRRRHADYDNGVWFSRFTGRDETGKKLYERLVTFSDRDTTARTLPEEVRDRLATAKPRQAPAPPTQAAAAAVLYPQRAEETSELCLLYTSDAADE